MFKTLLLSLILVCFSSIILSAQNPEILLLKTDGKVVIGDITEISTPDGYNLFVQNGILTERVKVALKDASDWQDGAFQQTPTIAQMKSSIEENSHLYEMPSADYLVENGYEVQQMDAELLKQIEWLWQHTIKLSEQNEQLLKEIEILKHKQN